MPCAHGPFFTLKLIVAAARGGNAYETLVSANSQIGTLPKKNRLCSPTPEAKEFGESINRDLLFRYLLIERFFPAGYRIWKSHHAEVTLATKAKIKVSMSGKPLF